MPHEQQKQAGRKGRASEYLVAAWLLHHLDVFVAIPPDPSSCDLIVQQPNGDLLKMQVKTLFKHNERWVANVCKSNGEAYTHSECDYFAFVFNGRLGENVSASPTIALVRREDVYEKTRISFVIEDVIAHWCDWHDAPTI